MTTATTYKHSRWTALSVAILIPFLSAIAGNAFIPESAMVWYEGLNHPWYKLPLWGSVLIALLIYIGYGTILYRVYIRHSWIAVLLGAVVLFGNEAWNLFFFGTRNLTLTFWVTVLFALIVFGQTLYTRKIDRLSFSISLIYLIWVVLYDLPWLYELMARN